MRAREALRHLERGLRGVEANESNVWRGWRRSLQITFNATREGLERGYQMVEATFTISCALSFASSHGLVVQPAACGFRCIVYTAADLRPCSIPSVRRPVGTRSAHTGATSVRRPFVRPTVRPFRPDPPARALHTGVLGSAHTGKPSSDRLSARSVPTPTRLSSLLQRSEYRGLPGENKHYGAGGTVSDHAFVFRSAQPCVVRRADGMNRDDAFKHVLGYVSMLAIWQHALAFTRAPIP